MHAALMMITLVFVSVASAAPPVGWRNDGSGKYPAANPPTQWAADTNILWKTETPGRSLASPVIVGDRVFVTAEPAELVCYSTTDGEKLWERSHQYADAFEKAKAERIENDLAAARELEKEVGDLQRLRDEARKAEDTAKQKELEEKINVLRERMQALRVFPPMPGGDTANTGSTPVSDGQNVFAVFGTGIVSSHTLAGERNWIKYIEAPSSGHSASPLLVEGKLIFHLKNLLALDPATGDVLWTAETRARHGSPVATRIDETAVIVTPEGAIVRVTDGKIVAKNQFQLNHSSPIAEANAVYATQDGSIKAVSLADASGEEAVTNVAWETTGSRTSRLASPVYHAGRIYNATEQGILEVTDAKTGDRVYRKRLDFAGGRVDSSIAYAGGRLYVSNTRGDTVVIAPGKDYEEISRNQLGEGFSSSLAFAGKKLFIRTPKHLYCIEQGAPRIASDKPSKR